jgi:hypothetical protein
VTASLTTWDEAGSLGDGVLFIVNSRDDNREEADATFARVSRASGAPPCVVAPASWRDWVRSKGVADAHSLFAEDISGGFLELNHFLWSVSALRWIRSNRVRVVIGSSPHQLHNYEVKEIFEQRVALFLRDGVFLAHTLPAPYLYQFDLPHLLRRMARASNTELYLSTSRAIVDDWYRLWRASGSPATCDSADFNSELAVVRNHLGDPVLAADEELPVSLPRTDNLATASVFVTKLNDLILEIEATYIERAAIAERDAAIDQLRIETDRLHHTLDSTIDRRLRRLISRLVSR